MQELLWYIDGCSPGISTHIENASNLLANAHTIEHWLATLRKTLIRQYADQHILKKDIIENDSIHVFNVYFKYAKINHWNPIGFEHVDAVNETHANLANITAEDFKLFSDFFFKHYIASSIMTEITGTLHADISEKIKQYSPLHINTGEEYQALLSEFPFTEHSNCLFNYVEIEQETDANPRTDIHFQYDQHILTLKSPSELKLALTQLLLEKTNDGLFQGELITLDSDLTASFMQLNPGLFTEGSTLTVGLISESPELCYIASTDKIVRLNQTAPTIGLDYFIKMQIPLTQINFEGYLNQGKTDFSECLLENIDFRTLTLSQFQELNFTCSTLINIKSSANQYLYLTRSARDISLSAFESSPIDSTYLTTVFYEKNFLLLYAVQANNPILIAKLIHDGADITWPDKDGYTALKIAWLRKHWKCVKAFAENISETKPDEFGYGRALIHAAKANQIETVAALIKANAACDWVLNEGNALHYAVINNNPDMIRILIPAGARCNKKNKSGHTPIHLAAHMKHWNCVIAFAETKPDLDDSSHSGGALLYAAKNNQLPALKALIQTNVTLNWAWSEDNSTALHFAAENNNPEMIRTLISAGAHCNAENKNKRTPIQVATGMDHWDCVIAFAESASTTITTMYNTGSALTQAARANQTNAVAALIKATSYYNVTIDNQTPLHYAAINNNPAMIRILLAAGAAPNNTNGEGHRPIDVAYNMAH
jgi:ankyrin repeat protein